MTASESYESSQHVVKAAPEPRVNFRQVAECRSNLEAREHLAEPRAGPHPRQSP
jgi:hypothetical protein